MGADLIDVISGLITGPKENIYWKEGELVEYETILENIFRCENQFEEFNNGENNIEAVYLFGSVRDLMMKSRYFIRRGDLDIYFWLKHDNWNLTRKLKQFYSTLPLVYGLESHVQVASYAPWLCSDLDNCSGFHPLYLNFSEEVVGEEKVINF